jgi:hypothetical protein
MPVTEDGGPATGATSDDVVPPQAPSDRRAKETNRTDCPAGPQPGRAWAVQDPYYRVAPKASTMAR